MEIWQDKNRECPPPPRPTKALPGTRAKKRVMRLRVALDYQPFHPDDAKWDDAAVERVLLAMMEIGGVEKKGRR